MKRILFPILLTLLFTCIVSCETDTIDGDGKIEGFWHMESIESLATDSTVDSVQDMSRKYVFWSFQHNLLELSDKGGEYQQLYCRFKAEDGQLTISEIYIPTYGKDSLATEASLPIIKPYGISKLNSTFSYDIDGGKMTLTGEGVRLRFKRF